ncbi:excinuclease Cho [Ewingella sp. S1.OA.A_B6]
MSRSEFDAEVYQYPEHLRASLTELPSLPGIYIFHGLSDRLPLYIGKSVNIRSRVMSHFRAKDEAKLLRQTIRISFMETAGELGALLTEARMIKEQQPLFNKRLRRSKQLCSLHVQSGKVVVAYAKDIDFATTQGLFGLFTNRSVALEKLRNIADEQKLCYGVLGIEKISTNRACFRFSLKRCAGACCSVESAEEHHRRLLLALESLRVNCWNWPGRIAIVEQGRAFTQYHIVQDWFYLGTVNSLGEAQDLQKVSTHFDSDGYKILCKPLFSGLFEIIEL